MTAGPDATSHAKALDVLARADADALRATAEAILDDIGDVEVVHSRTGLVMMPVRDPVQGAAFHVGEVLVAEAHIRAAGQEGYALRAGRDLEAAMAMAVVDCALQAGIRTGDCHALIDAEAARLAAEDAASARRTEATRVAMETF